MPCRDLLRPAQTLLACALVLALAAGCGSGGEEADPPLRGGQLAIWSSLPLHGPQRAVAQDVLDAQRLALAQHGGRVGRYRVRLTALDAATPKARAPEPSQISENARRAARSPATVAYLGELGTGSSAISIPLLNEAGILEVSPLDSSMALTTGSIAVTGSPQRFYPKQEEVGRTFARVVPSDRSQADAIVASMREQGVRRLAVMTDDEPSGLALATRVRALAHAAGIAVVARDQIDVHARDHADLVERIVLARPDAVLDGGGPREAMARLWRELHAADPELKLFGPAAFATPDFVGALGPAAEAAYLTRPVLGEDGGPPAGRAFDRRFARRYGRAPAPEARYGYEAMRSVLAAIARAERDSSDGRITRADVVDAYFRTRAGGGVLGPYAIEPSGDSTLVRWGGYRVADGRLRYAGPLLGGAGSGER